MRLSNQQELKRLDLDVSDTKCIILASCDGAAAEWNCSGFGRQVFPFDRIVQINGTPCEGHQLVSLLRQEQEPLELRLQRPIKRLLYLKKPGQLGFDLMYTTVRAGPWKASARPWIANIKDGLVAEWNKKMPELAVSCHDRILSVNGAMGSPSDLMDLLNAADGVVQLEVLSYGL